MIFHHNQSFLPLSGIGTKHNEGRQNEDIIRQRSA